MTTILEINLGPLLPALPEFIAGIVLFIVIWIVMAKKVVPAFEKTYQERSAAIQGGIEKAEAAQAEAAAALEEYRQQLAGARDEASSIREEAKAQGAQILAEMRTKAQEEADRLIAQAKAQIEAERVQAVQQLRGEIGGLATNLAGKIVGESLDDDERARRTVDRFIADLEASDAERV
ncbi:F0F1 ATP synthase subunit B [Micropruina sp.]|uniref:F0F1 ATP synthase subunit B n=1 Tax=Micropruina sp. TaxID=2737536 RepID=UPI00260C97EC|nr:F0F1 ATP synthase subunit B [Micropruina sp.]